MKKLFFFIATLFAMSSSFATNYWWVGGNGGSGALGAIGTLATSLGGTANAALITLTTADVVTFDGSDISATAGLQPIGVGSITFGQGAASYQIGQVILLNSAKVIYSSTSSGRNLTIGAAVSIAGTDFSITTGASFQQTGSSIAVAMLTGNTAVIAGTYTCGGGSNTHTFTSPDASGITFASGSHFVPGASGGNFGSSTANSVVFQSGSNYDQGATGANPFQLTAPATVTVLQPGSNFNFLANIAPSINGRTYGNFVVNAAAFSQSLTGATGCTVGNITISDGTANFNLTGAMNIFGNISVATGEVLTFTPASATNVNFNGTAAQSITNSGTLTFAANANVVISNTTAPVTFATSQTISGSLTVNSNATLATTGTLTLSGTPAINGSFQINQGGFATGGTWTYTSGTLIFNNSSGFYGVNADAYWPSSGGPTNVTVLGAGGLQMNVSRTVTGLFQTSAGVQGSALTLNGTNQINAGGFFNTAPVYGGSSTLIYNSASTYGRGNELTTGTGIPANLTVNAGSGLDYGNGATGTARTLTGTLTANGNFFMDFGANDMTVPITVNGDVNIGAAGAISLSDASGGDLILKGNWTRTTGGTLTPKGRAVFFQGGNAQTLTGVTTFDYLNMGKSANNLTLANNIIVNQTLTFADGTNGGNANGGNIVTGANTVTANSSVTTGTTTSHVNTNNATGGLIRPVTSGANTVGFSIGDASSYTPVSLTFSGSNTAAGTIRATTATAGAPASGSPTAGSGLSTTKYIGRTWTLTPTVTGTPDFQSVFTFVAGDIVGGANTSALLISRNNGGSYSLPGTLSSNSTSATSTTGQSGLSGIFQLGETGVVATPTINPATNTFTAFTTTYGTASAAQDVSVTGTDLTANISISAGTGFQVAVDAGSFGASATITQTGGSASGTLHVRLAPDAPVAGSYNSVTAATLSSTGATTRTYTTSASGNSVTAAALTITGVTANNKSYDGTTTATLSGTPAYSGLQNGETFSVSGTPSANFNNANVGTGKPVTVTGYTAPSANYTVSQPTGLTADITTAALTITGVTADNKSYDGTTTATLSGTPAYSGLQNGETFSVSGTPSANFNNANVGTGKPVTVTGYTAPSANYTVSQPTGLTADITTAALTITGVTADNKSYDGLTTATLSGTPAYSGLQNGETFSVSGTPSANFNNANVGTGKPVTVTGYTAPSANYTVSQPTGLTADITTAALTITGVTANNKSYDGLTTATLSGTPAYSGLQNGETFSVSGTPSANFNNANVGTGKPVTVTGYTAPSANYTVSQPTGLTADITTAALTITGVTANNKSYDGLTTATLSGTPAYSGLQNGETFSVSGTPSANFNNANVGTGKPVTVTGYTAPSANYTVSQPTGLTADITTAALTITGVTANNKSYDGLTTATLSGTPAYSGLQNGETFSVSGTPSADFNDANVGTGKPVTVTGYTAPSANYTVSQPTGLTANITTAALTITGVTAEDKPFDGNTTATLSGTPAYVGLQNGETFSVTGTPSANFNNASIGNNKPVTVTGYTAPSSNYTVSQPTGLTANITAIPAANADYRSQADGNFSSGSTWEYDLGGGNWTNAGSNVPASTNNVSITHNVTLDQNFTIGTGKTLLLGTGGTFVVNPTRTLTVTGTADFGGKSVTFRSTAAGVGSLGVVASPAATHLQNATNVTVERFIPNSSGFRKWELLSVPTYGSQTIKSAWQEGSAPLANNKPGYGTQIPGPGGTANGFDAVASGNAGSLLFWNGTGWSTVAATTGAISSNPLITAAYFLFVRGDRTKQVQGTNSNTNATTLESNGSLYAGNDTSASVAAGTFGLVGNPYASAVNFTGLTKTGGVTDVFYIWDAKLANGTGTGQYQTFSGTNYFTSVTGGSYGTSNTTIESGQAFLVRANGTSGTVIFHESDKISGTNGNLGFRPATPAALVKMDTRLHKVSINNKIVDGNAVVFDNAYSAEVDSHDALKLNNSGENFAVLTGTKSLAVEGRPAVTDKDVIAFKMWNMQQEAYQLELIPANLNIEGLTATLEDAYLHTSAPVSLEASTLVNFTVDANAGSSAADRFRIVFKKAAPVVIADAKPAYVISPNPAEGSNVNLRFINKAGGKYMIRVISNTGQAIFTNTAVHAGGNSTQVLSLPEGVAKGTYQVEIIAPDKTRTTQSLFVSGK